ncbi:GNAT family N-acetyltransferase [Deinococcus maricopensis]|uniref:GCN5-related N-acetyltransferase n=1 Tax=Deinococcus maricopensis (strain DSM 21211 / LMG 22137 / NRRL B-23946 / LB-34) TaxID=709986 RepID=E8UAH3_DEIML|nr:GNAT family N-acetyltransferase [Deinococcus maricopensis]ADV68062.1 GCN5-related N-acetyltransferase [Deinococcus maricopensis DSM 21211]
MQLVELHPTDPRVLALMDAQQAELERRYAPNSTEPFDPLTLATPRAALFAIQDGAQLLACGGLKPLSETEAELKRMYTAPDARGQRLGHRIVDALTQHARTHGFTRIVLETGVKQPEAIRLYERAGFTRIPNYGYYVDSPQSVCYALNLT